MQEDHFEITSFPDLRHFQAAEAGDRKLRVCIATEEIFGPVRNGGIASTYYHLARMLAADGHDVTVFYFKGQKCENMTIPHWIDFYRDLGINFVPLAEDEVKLACPAPGWQSRYYNFYRWLKEQPSFDVVHTSEWRGGAFYALQAKKQGLAFRDTLFLVKSSSPWIWNRHYTMRTVQSIVELPFMFAERRTVELADMVIGGSAHLLSFMRHKGYRLPGNRTFVQPNIIDLQDLDVEEKRPHYEYGEKVKSREIVFFGRLEGRKGLEIFCDAIDRLLEEGILPDLITFMGKEGARLPSHANLTSREYIAMKSEAWPTPVKVIDNYDQDKAIGYLCEQPRIAVMPSIIENSTMAAYECLVHRIPFIATSVGGTPELIDPAYHEDTLVPPHPEPLSQALRRVLDEGGTVAKSTFSYEDNLEVWRRFHRFLGARLSASTVSEFLAQIAGEEPSRSLTSPAALPKVSICVYHHEQPLMLEALLEAIAGQDVAPDEVIVVTDGKPSPEAAEKLTGLAARFADLGWRFLHTPHRCVGAAYNHAAELASGDVLLFLHAERHLPKPAMVGTITTAANSSNAVAFTFFHDRFEGSVEPGETTERVVPLGGDLASSFFTKDVLGATCLAVRKNSLAKIGGFAEMYHVSGVEDELLVRLQLDEGDVEVVPEVLYWERKTESKTAFNDASGSYLKIRPFLDRAPIYQEVTFLLAREQHARLDVANARVTWLRNENNRLKEGRVALASELEKARRELAVLRAGGAASGVSNDTSNLTKAWEKAVAYAREPLRAVAMRWQTIVRFFGGLPKVLREKIRAIGS